MQNFAKFETIVFARDLLSGLVGFVEDYPLELTCDDKSLLEIIAKVVIWSSIATQGRLSHDTFPIWTK